MMSAIADTIPLTAEMVEMSGIKEKSGKDVATMDDFCRVVGAYFGFDKTYEPKHIARVPKLITPKELESYDGDKSLYKTYMDEKLRMVKRILAKEKALEPVIEKIEDSFYNDKGKIHVEFLGADREKYDLYIYAQWRGGEWIGKSLYEGYEDGVVDFQEQYGEFTIHISDISGESFHYKVYSISLPEGNLQDITKNEFINMYFEQKNAFED